MPIYEYICDDCQTAFEKLVINKQEAIACPKCAGRQVSIQLSVFSSAVAGGSKSSGSSSGGGSCCGGGCGCH